MAGTRLLIRNSTALQNGCVPHGMVQAWKLFKRYDANDDDLLSPRLGKSPYRSSCYSTGVPSIPIVGGRHPDASSHASCKLVSHTVSRPHHASPQLAYQSRQALPVQFGSGTPHY